MRFVLFLAVLDIILHFQKIYVSKVLTSILAVEISWIKPEIQSLWTLLQDFNHLVCLIKLFT